MSPNLLLRYPPGVGAKVPVQPMLRVPGLPARARAGRVVYITNANRERFPNDDAVIELLWLAIRDIEDKRARACAKKAYPPTNAEPPADSSKAAPPTLAPSPRRPRPELPRPPRPLPLTHY